MFHIDRILVPIDFSEFSAAALAYGRELARLHNAELDLLHVLEEPAFPAFYKMGEEALYGEASTLEKRCHEALQSLIEEAEGEPPKEGLGVHVQRGKPADEIIEFAQEHDVDLIVISSHGLSAVERVLIGSTAEHVIRRAPCPLFVLKSFGKMLLDGIEVGG